MIKHNNELTNMASSSAFAYGKLHLEWKKAQNDVRVLEEKLSRVKCKLC